MKIVRIRRPSPAMLVALLSLFVALGGTSWAALKIGSKQIRNDSIKSVDIRNGQVTSADIKNGTIRGIDVAANALTGAKIDERTLGEVPTAAAAKSATSAASASNASALGGVAAAGYQRGCQPGAVKGYVLINGSAGFPTTFTSDPSRVPNAFNCTGGTVEAKRNSAGNYTVRFAGLSSSIFTGMVTKSSFVDFVQIEQFNAPNTDNYQLFESGNHDVGLIMVIF